jgi:hypothetical protein
MKSLMLFFATVTIWFDALSQDPDSLGNIYDNLFKKKEGTVYLKDGRKVSGYIDYSTFTNVLRVKSNEPLPKSLTPQNVARLEYFDESLQRHRVFTAREFELQKYDIGASTEFFEILRSYDNLQLASRACPVNMWQKVGSPNANVGYNGRGTADYRQKLVTFTDQLEIVCFIANDKIHPYLIIKTREVENNSGRGLRNNSSRKHVKVVDRGLPERIMGAKYKLVDKFASSNKFRWNDKDELALILDYYMSLK